MDCSPPASSDNEHWNGLPFPTPGDLSNRGIKPMSLASPALAGGFFITYATWETPIFQSGGNMHLGNKH